MEVMKAIKSRRSIRTYIKKVVPPDILEKIVEAGTWAPNACNRQGFRFVAVIDDKVKSKIVNDGAAAFVKDAPVALFVFYDNRTDNTEYCDHIQSASAVIQNMLLAAKSLGVGTCWVCHLPRKCVLRKSLGVPDSFDPIACVTMGYHKNNPKPMPRRPAKDVLCYDTFSFPAGLAGGEKLAAKRMLRKLYFKMPPGARKAAGPLASRFEKRFEGT